MNLLLDKLEEIEEKYVNIENRLYEPSVIQNREEYTRLLKEKSELEEIVTNFRELKRVIKEIEDNKELLQDPEFKELATEEIKQLEKRKKELEEKLKILLLPKDPYDGKDILLEIRAGTGGEEAALFAAELFRMYARYAEKKGWQVEVISKSESATGGFKEIISSIRGKNVYSYLKYESGVHRVQRVPVTESQGRIHTSAATVAVLPEADEIDIKIDEKDLEIEVMRASGPGGQSVNTTDSAVRITHKPTGIVVKCQDEKSQHKNKAKALKILRARLFELERKKQQEEMAKKRREQVRSGDRSEKIRTYNFPQDRVTDHRIGLTLHNIQSIMDGELDELIDSLRTYFQTEMLKKRD